MGRTNTKKLEAREARLRTLPKTDRLTKSALIKKKEGRILDASEKHALKMTSEHGEMLRLWEKLRTFDDKTKADDETEESASGTSAIKKTAYEHKYPIVEKLLRLLEPKFAALVRTPSGSRVVQSMIKYGSPAHVEKLTKLISRDFADHAKDAYAHFVVCALIRHASHELFKTLLAQVVPAVPVLISHKFGIEVIHATYSSRWATSLDRNLLLLAIFKDNVAVMKRWEGYPVFEDVVAGNAALKKRLLTRLFDLGDKLVSQKEAVEFPFVQRLLYAFIRHGTREEVSELCDTLRPHLAKICLGREGAVLTSLAFSLTEPKRRKEVLRGFNDILGELSTSKYGAPVVARLLDLLYDPQMQSKFVVNDLALHLSQLVNSPYGYLILIHLLTPNQARKDKFMLPNWQDHNLFSFENKDWNHHTWLTSDYEKETVEICGKPAMTSHLMAIPTLARAFMQLISDPEKLEKLSRHHVKLIAREILAVEADQPLYKTALNLTAADRKTLEAVSPAQGEGEKRARDDENTTDASAPAKKKARTATSESTSPAAKKAQKQKPVGGASKKAAKKVSKK